MPRGIKILQHHRGEVGAAAALGFGQTEAGIFRGDADVAGERQLAAAGQRIAVHRCDERLIGFDGQLLECGGSSKAP